MADMADAALQLAQAAHHLRAAKMFQLASFVFLLYDHLISFSEEVERIWMKRWSLATLLFALNRYVTPLQFLVIIVAFHSEAWTKNIPACERFVRFEGGATLALVAICEIIMMMRVYALWGRDNRVLTIIVFLWIAQVAGSAMALSFSKRAPLPPGFVGCILTGKNILLLPIWVMPLITDTVIFALTVWRSRQYMVYQASMPMLRLLVRDGTQYFFCIFAANLLNSILYLAATSDLKAIGASFSQMITSVMISRLVLNLRTLHDADEDESTYRHSGLPVIMTLGSVHRRNVIPMSTMEDGAVRNGGVTTSEILDEELENLNNGVDVTWSQVKEDDAATAVDVLRGP